jgi:hypothetical protein
MKNIMLGVALGIGAAGVVVAIVLALSGGNDETTVVETAPATPSTTATAPGTAGESTAGPGPETTAADSNASVDALARAYCEVEQRDPDDFAREFGTGEQAMSNCIEREIAAAGRECETDKATDPDDYMRQFGGSDDAALERCLKYELQSF